MTSIDDDDVRAAETRLRTSGWANKPEPYFQPSRIHPTAPLVPIEQKVSQTARWIAHHWQGVWPTYQETADEFGLTYDQAVLAVGEARRLVEKARK